MSNPLFPQSILQQTDDPEWQRILEHLVVLRQMLTSETEPLRMDLRSFPIPQRPPTPALQKLAGVALRILLGDGRPFESALPAEGSEALDNLEAWFRAYLRWSDAQLKETDWKETEVNMVQEKKVYPDANQATVAGAIIRQDLRYTPNGKAVLRVVVGVATGEVHEYVPIKVLGTSAERLAERLEKEDPNLGLWVQGKLSYYRKDDHESVDLLADRVEVIRPRADQLVTRPDRTDPFLIGGENRVMLSGMVATEPESRTLPNSGEQVLRFRLATRLENGESGFTTVSAYGPWGAQLELSRGTRVVVVGRYRTYSTVNYSPGEDPERRYHSEVRAQEIWPLVLPVAAPRKSDPLEEFPPEEDLPF